MRNHVGEALNEWKNIFLATAGMVALCAQVIMGALTVPRLRTQASAGQSTATDDKRPTFDVASVKVNKSGGDFCTTKAFSCYSNLGKPGLVTITNLTLRDLVGTAYYLTDVQSRLTSDGPKWMDSERFDIEARVEGNPGLEQKRLMLQALLADRFKLVVHHVMRQGPVYALVLVKAGKTGPGLRLHSDAAKCIDLSSGTPPHPGDAFCGGFLVLARDGQNHATGNNISMEGLARQLGGFSEIDRTVVDRTDLRGTFELTLEWTAGSQIDAGTGASDPSAPPSLFTALKEQLGLKMESQMGPVDVLVIDQVTEPSAN